MKLPHDTIILVVDGARMLLLRNVADAVLPDLQVIEHRQNESLPSRELSSDAPGTTFSSGSPARSSYDEGDPHVSEEIRFVASVAKALDSLTQAEAGDIIIAAAPRALGILRSEYSDRVRAKVIAEVDKDFTHLPVPQIAQRLMML
ncbi:host attachment family protein [Altererythrobacter sp. KTW20L]|uniref:baeRF12 domain-containing protein n=1 Tax=Altererythrobacter sp. KTW20L TaxID=2942210 RepID=UPI0020BDD768|nr:host attachment family protein [Altererythrobacter sp. KTW20L]MCL6251233.1 host attachment family protein [Altererythrobacter sp. KTW20L]